MEDVHSYFAADVLVTKLRKLMADMRAPGRTGGRRTTSRPASRPPETRPCAPYATSKNWWPRAATTLRLGRHVFTISRQPLELDPGAPWRQAMAFHLTGTDYFAPVTDTRLDDARAYWQQALPSENAHIARAEYLAGCWLQSAQRGDMAPGWDAVQKCVALGADGHGELLAHLRQFIATRYQDGYEKGVHDEDAVRIICALVKMQEQAGLLAWGPTERALALLYWQDKRFGAERESLQRRARAALKMAQLFGAHQSLQQLEPKRRKPWRPLPRHLHLKSRKPCGKAQRQTP
jgi:hypothetical protein